ncbi:hypothetical protein G7Y89_g10670 [Cudoniella acicularis]|uniref:USP domain-containing protein n=1 Tax=Cudoniella acicularis TaxID=354080 RepID=A0A8H4RCB5_9HELO|nr:hypothetical protein G7Y89_g10670 [Cudoniella acicularis]
MSSPSPRSPKRAHLEDEGPSRAAKHQKLKENLPDKFKGIKEEKELSSGEDDRYGGRTKIAKLDDTTEDEMTRRVKVANWAGMIKRRRETAGKLSDDRSRMPAASQRGMPNFTGVLCYRIALLQALLHLPLLVNWLLDFVLPEHCVSDNSQECFACVLRLLTVEYWKVPGGVRQVSPVFRAMHGVIKRLGWTETGQADPDEQMLFFFKKMQTELPSSIYGLIESLFQSFWTQQINCHCGTTSLTHGSEIKHTLCLSPRIPDGRLDQYIRRVYREAVPYRCEGCHILKTRPKLRLFHLSAAILCIQLSRCDETGRKITYSVNIPDELDFSNVAHEENKDCLKYKLCAVVQHKGSARGGHYVYIFLKALK